MKELNYYLRRLYGLAEAAHYNNYSSNRDYVIAYLDGKENKDDCWEMNLQDYIFLQEIKGILESSLSSKSKIKNMTFAEFVNISRVDILDNCPFKGHYVSLYAAMQGYIIVRVTNKEPIIEENGIRWEDFTENDYWSYALPCEDTVISDLDDVHNLIIAVSDDFWEWGQIFCDREDK